MAMTAKSILKSCALSAVDHIKSPFKACFGKSSSSKSSGSNVLRSIDDLPAAVQRNPVRQAPSAVNRYIPIGSPLLQTALLCQDDPSLSVGLRVESRGIDRVGSTTPPASMQALPMTPQFRPVPAVLLPPQAQLVTSPRLPSRPANLSSNPSFSRLFPTAPLRAARQSAVSHAIPASSFERNRDFGYDDIHNFSFPKLIYAMGTWSMDCRNALSSLGGNPTQYSTMGAAQRTENAVLKNLGKLGALLTRWTFSEEYKTANPTQREEMHKEIVQILETAKLNAENGCPRLKEKLFEIASTHDGHCSDRAILGVKALKIAFYVDQAEKGLISVEEVKNFALGTFIEHTVEEQVFKHLHSKVSLHESLENVLYALKYFNGKFKLPSKVTHMTFEVIGKIDRVDLDKIEAEIRSIRTEAVLEYLSTFAPWQAVLQKQEQRRYESAKTEVSIVKNRLADDYPDTTGLSEIEAAEQNADYAARCQKVEEPLAHFYREATQRHPVGKALLAEKAWWGIDLEKQ